MPLGMGSMDRGPTQLEMPIIRRPAHVPCFSVLDQRDANSAMTPPGLRTGSHDVFRVRIQSRNHQVRKQWTPWWLTTDELALRKRNRARQQCRMGNVRYARVWAGHELSRPVTHRRTNRHGHQVLSAIPYRCTRRPVEALASNSETAPSFLSRPRGDPTW